MPCLKNIFVLILSFFWGISHSFAQDDNIRRIVDSLNLAYGKAEERSLVEAEKVSREALELAISHKYLYGQAQALSNIGVVHLRQGSSTKAIEHFFEALKIFEQIEGHQDMLQYGLVFVRLGGIYYFDGDFKKSLEYIRKGYAIAERKQYSTLLGVSCRVMGEVHRDQGGFDSASYFFNKAVSAFKNDPKNLAAIYIDIGLNYYYQKDYHKAIEYNQLFYSMAQKLGVETDYSVGLHNIGEFYYLLKSYKNAILYLDSSQRYSLQFQQFRILLDTYQVKARVYRALGKADSVAVYSELAMSIKDSLNNEAYQKELASLNAKLDLYRHEAENDLLKKDQRIFKLYLNIAFIGLIAVGAILGFVLIRQKLRVQKKVKERLEIEVKERTAEIEAQTAVIEQINLKLQLALSRSKVDPHFVFNVLNSIQHLVMERKPQEASDHLARLSRLTRYILEKSSLDEVPLQEDLRMLDQYVKLEQFRLDNKFRYITEIHAEDNLMMPAMLVQPFVENSIIHGLTPSQKPDLFLRISFTKKNEILEVVIEDNGVGRQYKPKRTNHNSIGGSLGSHRLEILSKLEGQKFECQFEDLVDEMGVPSGTKVILQVPVKAVALV